LQKYFFDYIFSQVDENDLVYIHDIYSISELEKKIKRENIDLFIYLPALKMEDFFNVVDNKQFLPAHSTCFLPKPRAGIISFGF
jgi:uncharacterized protein (DUF1015 family)